jgi:hypothetical protein
MNQKMVRKTTIELMIYFPKDVALLTESFIMTMGIHDQEFPTGWEYLKNLAAGHLESIFSHRDQYELDDAVTAACIYGHIDILKSLISRGANRLSQGIHSAIKNNNLECLEYIYNIGGQDPCDGLRSAVTCQNLAAAKLMIARGATNYSDLFKFTDNFDFISLGLSYGGSPDHESMIFAGEISSLGVIVLLHSFGGNYHSAFMGAFQAGRINIMNRLIDRCELDYSLEDLFFFECHMRPQNRQKIIDFLIARGVKMCPCRRPSTDHPLIR